jgi:hypothetical protein
VFVDDEGMLNLVTLGVIKEPESNTRQAELIEQDVMRILEEGPHKAYDMIVNLLPLGRGGYASSKARKIYLQISSHRQIRRFAIVGGSVFVRTMAGFFIRAAGKASSGARKVYAQMLKSERMAKHAFVGMRTLTRVIVSFIIRASGAKNAMFFATEEEALRWLKEGV